MPIDNENPEVITIGGENKTLSRPIGGTFKISFGKKTTAAIPYDASESQIEDELARLYGVHAETVRSIRVELARHLGRKGGAVKSARKTAAVRRNGKLGGRKRKVLLTPEDLAAL